MIGFYLWALVASVAVLVQGYFFPAVSSVAPSLLVIVLLVSALQLSHRLVFRLALWLGLLLDVISTYPFGVYTFVSLTATLLLYWLLRKGVTGSGFVSLTLLLLPALLWQAAVLLLVQGAGVFLSVPVLTWLVSLGMQVLVTVVFAWLIVGRVQLRV